MGLGEEVGGDGTSLDIVADSHEEWPVVAIDSRVRVGSREENATGPLRDRIMRSSNNCENRVVHRTLEKRTSFALVFCILCALSSRDEGRKRPLAGTMARRVVRGGREQFSCEKEKQFWSVKQ